MRAFTRTMVAAAVETPPPEADPAPTSPQLPARRVKAKQRGGEVQLLEDDGTDCPSEALGLVQERSTGDDKAAVERLKARASALGANTIAGYKATRSLDGATQFIGVAVRCHDLTEAKKSDTLGPVDVPMPAGGVEEAFADLLDQAERMHASLITDVHVEPRDDGPHVVGTAIRYRR